MGTTIPEKLTPPASPSRWNRKATVWAFMLPFPVSGLALRWLGISNLGAVLPVIAGVQGK
jgi:hypothetical protein